VLQGLRTTIRGRRPRLSPDPVLRVRARVRSCLHQRRRRRSRSWSCRPQRRV